MKRTFQAKSSSGGSYEVVFHFLNGTISANCNCKAGIMKKGICKHRIKLLCGDDKMLYDSSQKSDLEQLISWVQQSDYSDLIPQYVECENVHSKAKRELDKHKKILLSKMQQELIED